VNKNEEEPAIKKSKPDPDDDTDQPVVEWQVSKENKFKFKNDGHVNDAKMNASF
jgi:hypothetical protein